MIGHYLGIAHFLCVMCSCLFEICSWNFASNEVTEKQNVVFISSQNWYRVSVGMTGLIVFSFCTSILLKNEIKFSLFFHSVKQIKEFLILVINKTQKAQIMSRCFCRPPVGDL